VDRLKRITDLFVEGDVLVLGDDESGTPVVIWVNKLNSFEDEECRRDGLAARAERLLMLTENHPEIVNISIQMDKWSHDDLVEQAARQKYDEDYLLSLDDIESEEAWREKLDYLRRMDTIHNDANLPDDDPRRTEYVKWNEDYYKRLRELADKRQEERRQALTGMSVEDVRSQFLEDVKQRLSMDTFMEERKITEIFFSARDCQGTRVEDRWDHSACNHRVRLIPNRSEVRSLPEDVIRKIVDKLSEVTVDRRTAGNSDAPASSSASSELLKQEEDSTLFTQEVTAPVVVST